MLFRTAYELLLWGVGVIVAWKLIIQPAYALIFGRSLKVGKNAVVGDTLSAAEQQLEDERILTEANKILRKAETIREKRAEEKGGLRSPKHTSYNS